MVAPRRSSASLFNRRACARPAVFALAALLAAGLAAAQAPAKEEPAALSLADALRTIAARSTAAVSAGLDLEAAKAATRRTESSYYPSVSVSGGYMARDNSVVAVFGPLEAPTTEKDFFTGELDVNQLLWDGGRRASAMKGLRSAEDAVSLRGAADVQSAQLDGMAAYLGVLVSRAQRKVVAQRTTGLEDHLREVKDLYQEGVAARNDLLETEVRLRTVQDQGRRVDDDEAVAVQGLNRLLGRDPGDPLALPAGLPSPPPLTETPEQLKKRAADGNAELGALNATLRAEEDTVAQRKAETRPTLFAQASHSYQQNRYLLYPNATSLFLGVDWQAYDGGARRAAVREAEFAAAKTRERIADLRRRLDIRVERAFREYRQALREAATAETNVKASEENLRIVEDQYKAGLARTTDVLDAESTLAQSRFALANQHYDAYLKQAILLTAAGEDLPAFYAGLPTAQQEP